MNVQEIGEQGLLKLVQSFCPPDFVGDDAAVLTTHRGRSLVVTTDVLIDGVHFSDQTTSAADAGWRAAAANLSDLAAMGATPLGITVGLGLPGNTPVAWIEGLYRGLTECLNQYETSIVGGDLCRSPVLSIAITAFGEAAPNQLIRRSTARPGDAIVATGIHGASKAGLELLLHPALGEALSERDRALLIHAHQRPKPRLDVVEWLWAEGRGQGEGSEGAIQTDAQHLIALASPSSPASPSSYSSLPSPIAGMDSSDGLADAIVQICRASGVGAIIDRSQISLPSALQQWVGTEQALDWALYGGEDFELILCLPLTWAQALVQRLGNGAAIIGTITEDLAVWLVGATGNQPDQPLTLERGFQHFSG
ncbi:thiamine-phosphate kinase [Leptolyngbya sp. FACHB-321]|uniref:thiamine-phosphate kinase n=1 Tax=Leptolyngbya sp. FACHB-321 TaxID=2692807 RepID=UPI001686F7B2|nr:thiamine-phosphate kinase [Leptolyngbya sp. FACHB-321]MBD2038920.1 thiamine-phosphate kinase [Leptolyngbya sp. FACHB-321]